MLINKHSSQTLLPDKYLDDNVVNVFCEILIQKYPENMPLIFDAQFLYSLLQCQDGRVGFMKWAQNRKAWTFDIWLLSLCNQSHWTLFVVIFLYKCIVYLD